MTDAVLINNKHSEGKKPTFVIQTWNSRVPFGWYFMVAKVAVATSDVILNYFVISDRLVYFTLIIFPR